MITEKDLAFWQETARRHADNEQYYRSLLIEIGNMFGLAARIQDDGGISHDVLCAKLPQVVAEFIANHYHQLEQAKTKRIPNHNRGLLEKSSTAFPSTD